MEPAEPWWYAPPETTACNSCDFSSCDNDSKIPIAIVVINALVFIANQFMVMLVHHILFLQVYGLVL